MTDTASSNRIDVRAITPRERHPLIFSTFRALAGAQSMEIVNDHDPRPLFYQMQSERPGQFSWDYLESGPEVWRVRITRVAPNDNANHSTGQCCGSCGGS